MGHLGSKGRSRCTPRSTLLTHSSVRKNDTMHPATRPAAAEHNDIIYPSAIPFVLVHLACLGAIWSGVTWTSVVICVALYWIRIFAVGAGYHRYFSHRAYATSRVFQFVLAVLAQS